MNHRRWATILLIAALLGNAIAPGVCAAVCDFRDFRASVSTRMIDEGGCAESECGIPADDQDSCCDWIGERAENALSIARSFQLSQLVGIGTFNTACILPPIPAELEIAASFTWRDRAPPDPPPLVLRLRGPPVGFDSLKHS